MGRSSPPLHIAESVCCLEVRERSEVSRVLCEAALSAIVSFDGVCKQKLTTPFAANFGALKNVELPHQ